MSYTKEEFFEFSTKISDRVCSVNDYPEGFRLDMFVKFADDYMKTKGILPFLKDGVFKALVHTTNNCNYAYDSDDYEEHAMSNLEKFDVYKILKICLSWVLTNECDPFGIDDLKAHASAIESFNYLKNKVLELPVEHALLVSAITEDLHNEIGGMCHECDEPPLNTEYIMTNNHNYGDIKDIVVITEALDLRTSDSHEYILQHLDNLRNIMSVELKTQTISGMDFTFGC